MGDLGCVLDDTYGEIDFKQLKEEVSFIILTTGINFEADEKIREYYEQAKKVGLKVEALLHHSTTGTKQEMERQAEFCAEKAKEAGFDTPVCIYVSWDGGTIRPEDIELDDEDPDAVYTIPEAYRKDILTTFLRTVKTNGFRGGVAMAENFTDFPMLLLKTVGVWGKTELKRYRKPNLVTVQKKKKLNGIGEPVELVKSARSVSMREKRKPTIATNKRKSRYVFDWDQVD